MARVAGRGYRGIPEAVTVAGGTTAVWLAHGFTYGHLYALGTVSASAARTRTTWEHPRIGGDHADSGLEP
ncbi:hypothetical protein [Streptomyces spongiae]|uniref:Uncharacterized protein n=1 Tax=Streptomyces spongiae TaxID=565072 RepID=A0A5N8XA37_9ACTN|nr:hypothetical protein [Streptomyces spongiae]MPY56370.1 hypothetical protein [Streptomyces spongiae]